MYGGRLPPISIRKEYCLRGFGAELIKIRSDAMPRVVKLSKLPRMYLFCISIWIFSNIPILSSSWAGDDWPNSQTPYWVNWRNGSTSFLSVLNDALYWNRSWMFGQGRFYPAHWIESRFAFSVFREVLEYKTYQFLMLVFAGVLFSVLILKLTKSWKLASALIFCLSITVQYRRDFDPHLAYAVMLPTILVKVFGSAILANLAGTKRKWSEARFYSIGSAVLYFSALCTYEFSFLLFPLILISYFLGKESRIGAYRAISWGNLLKEILRCLDNKLFLPVLSSWLLYGFLVFGVLRQIARDISASYTLGVSIESLGVFFTQIFLGIPLISLRNQDLRFDSNSIIIAIFASLTGLVFFFRHLRMRRQATEIIKWNIPVQGHRSLLLIGFNLIAAPAVMMSIQPVWWGRASLLHGYLGVMLTEFGTALVLGVLLLRFLEFIEKSQKGISPKGLN